MAVYKTPATKIADRLDRMLTGVVEYTQGQRSNKPSDERIEGRKAALNILAQPDYRSRVWKLSTPGQRAS